MTMKHFLFFLVLLLFLKTPHAFALGRFAAGPELGFVYQTHRDPTGGKLQGAPGVEFGIGGVYQFDRLLSHLAIDYAVGLVQTSPFTYRDIQIEGANGTFRENVFALHWLLGGRYYFGKRKWQPYGGVAVGFQYFRRQNISYRDRFNGALPIPPVSSSFNLALVPSIGLEYRPTFRWAIGLALKPFFSFRRTGVVPAIQVPLSIQITF